MTDKDAAINVLMVSPERVIYEGCARSIVVPGERGVFEILPFHKRLLSRLLGGKVIIDGKQLPIERGVVKVGLDQTVIIVEEHL